ncbi:MAG: zf-HC2 domain-containing protein [Deltaproteobacteria bacterium]|nr:zf-HC2 domain-containing protein [Deltaproteobacteria bacterium]
MSELKTDCFVDETLSAYLDGDVEEARREEILAHLNDCADCRRAMNDLTELSTGLGALGVEQPSPATWSEIERRYTSSARSIWGGGRLFYWLVPTAMAAAAVLALMLGPWDAEQPSQKPVADPIAALEGVQRAEIVYREAIDALETVVAAEKNGFEPQTIRVVERSLAEIEVALERCREAISEDPKNLEARRALLAAYQQKVDLLTELVEQQI